MENQFALTHNLWYFPHGGEKARNGALEEIRRLGVSEDDVIEYDLNNYSLWIKWNHLGTLTRDIIYSVLNKYNGFPECWESKVEKVPELMES